MWQYAPDGFIQWFIRHELVGRVRPRFVKDHFSKQSPWNWMQRVLQGECFCTKESNCHFSFVLQTFFPQAQIQFACLRQHKDTKPSILTILQHPLSNTPTAEKQNPLCWLHWWQRNSDKKKFLPLESPAICLLIYFKFSKSPFNNSWLNLILFAFQHAIKRMHTTITIINQPTCSGTKHINTSTDLNGK